MFFFVELWVSTPYAEIAVRVIRHLFCCFSRDKLENVVPITKLNEDLILLKKSESHVSVQIVFVYFSQINIIQKYFIKFLLCNFNYYSVYTNALYPESITLMTVASAAGNSFTQNYLLLYFQVLAKNSIVVVFSHLSSCSQYCSLPSLILTLPLFPVSFLPSLVCFTNHSPYSLMIQYTYSVFLTWYQSHYSDFFFTVLSLIGVIPNSRLLPPLQLLLQPFAIKPLTHLSHCLWFRIYSRHHSESRDHCHIVATVILALIVFLQVPLRSSSANLLLGGNLIVIGGPTRLHAPPKVLAS